MSLGTPGLQYAERARVLLENIGRNRDLRAPAQAVEELLVAISDTSGDRALSEIRDQATALAPALGAEKSLVQSRSVIGALLGTYAKGKLKTRAGRAFAQGTPVDQERLARFEALAAHLQSAPLPHIERAVQGIARQNAAFMESYFSNCLAAAHHSNGVHGDGVLFVTENYA